MEPIEEIPEHIKALPEQEQGPALVEAIHRRKALAQAWEHYGSIPAPTYDPFKATREKLAELHEETGKPVQYTQRRNGPSSLQVWIDEAQEWREVGGAVSLTLTPEENLFREPGRLVPQKLGGVVEMTFQDVSHEFFDLLVGGRGFGKRHRAEEWQRIMAEKERKVREAYPPVADAPPVDVDNVRWNVG